MVLYSNCAVFHRTKQCYQSNIILGWSRIDPIVSWEYSELSTRVSLQPLRLHCVCVCVCLFFSSSLLSVFHCCCRQRSSTLYPDLATKVSWRWRKHRARTVIVVNGELEPRRGRQHWNEKTLPDLTVRVLARTHTHTHTCPPKWLKTTKKLRYSVELQKLVYYNL